MNEAARRIIAARAEPRRTHHPDDDDAFLANYREAWKAHMLTQNRVPRSAWVVKHNKRNYPRLPVLCYRESMLAWQNISVNYRA